MGIEAEGTTGGEGAGAGAAGAGSAADILGGGVGAGSGAGAAAAAADGAGGADAAAGAAGAGAGEGQAISGGADPDWYGTLSAEPLEGDKPSLRDWVKAAGVRDLNGLAKIARDNQTALRDSGRVKVPGEGASEAEVKAFQAAIGVPEAASEYAISIPKDDAGNDLPVDKALVDAVAAMAVKHGVPKPAFEGLIAEMMQHDLDLHADRQRAQDVEAAGWQKKQGTALNEKISAIDNAATALGLTGQELQALRAAWGPDRALTVLAQLGAGIAEDKLITGGDRGRFGVSGEAAQAEMDRLKADPAFFGKAVVPGTPENLRWNRLQDAVGAAAERKRLQAA